MGNQCTTAKNASDYLDQQLQIYRWRSQVQHNTHIARTYISRPMQRDQHYLQKMINSQLSSEEGVNLQKLMRVWREEKAEGREEEFLRFQRYWNSVVVLRGELTMEENIYALNTLLSGYESIYRKMGEICVDERCCFVTEEGELRAWVNPDPTQNFIDCSLSQQEMGSRYRLVYTSEAGICKRLMEMSIHLSDGNRQYLQFHQNMKQFTVKNMLQNLNFRAIRLFINRYVYQHMITLAKSLIKVMERIEREDDRVEHSCSGSRRDQQSCQYISDSFVTSQYSSDENSKGSKKIQLMNRSIQTSQVQDNGISTSVNTPKKNGLTHFKRLTFSSSEFFKANSHKNKNESDHEETNINEVVERKVNFVQSEESNKSLIIIPRRENFKLTRYHSYHPSRDQENFFKCSQEEDKIIPSQCFMRYNRDASRDQEDHTNLTENGLSNQDSRTQQGSRALTRVVSGLVSNNEITVCESMGSFQSVDRSSDSGYEGVLLTMGRSVMNNNEPMRKKTNTHFRGFSTRAPHATY